MFLFNDFLMFVTPRVLFAKTATGAELEPFGKNEFVIYRKVMIVCSQVDWGGGGLIMIVCSQVDWGGGGG